MSNQELDLVITDTLEALLVADVPLTFDIEGVTLEALTSVGGI